MPRRLTFDERAEQLEQLWADGNAVNLLATADYGYGMQSCYSHGLITHVLRKLAYCQSSESCVVRYFYGDSNRKRKLCVPHLVPYTSSRPGPQRTHQFYVGLLAGRHTAMEPGIDFHLLLNHEVNPNMGKWTDEYEAERVACKGATDMFNELPSDSAVRLVQTGWVPVVMGFYRAYLDFVNGPEGRRAVTVEPVITRPKPCVELDLALQRQATDLQEWAPSLFKFSDGKLILLREGGLSLNELAEFKKTCPKLMPALSAIQRWAKRVGPAF